MVQRRITSHKTPSRNDTPNVSKTDNPSTAKSSVKITIEIHDIPTDGDGQCRKSSHSDKNNSSILHWNIIVYVEENTNTCDGYEEWKNDKGGAMAQAVGEEGYYEGEDVGSCERGSAMHLCANSSIVISFDDRRKEISKAIAYNHTS